MGQQGAGRSILQKRKCRQVFIFVLGVHTEWPYATISRQMTTFDDQYTRDKEILMIRFSSIQMTSCD